jgi:hypothetical protein
MTLTLSEAEIADGWDISLPEETREDLYDAAAKH